MADLGGTPFSVRWTGAEARVSPVRVSATPFAVRFTAAAADARVTAQNAADALTIPTLDYLLRQEKIVNPDGTPSQRFQFIWQEMVDRLISAFSAVDARDTYQENILARLTAAEKLAAAANDNAAVAKETASAASEAAQATFTQIDPQYGQAYETRFGEAVP